MDGSPDGALSSSDGGLHDPVDAGDGGDDGGTPDASVPDASTPTPFEFLPLQTSIPDFALEIDPAVYRAILDDLYSDEERPAVFVADGVRHDVLVRLRGSSSRKWPKKSWRVEFPNGKFDGRKKHNYIAEYQDATLMAEKLGYDLLLATSTPGPNTRFVNLTINGHYEGVFVDVERVDKDFLDAHRFDDRDATIYRCGAKDCEMKLWRTSYQKKWDKETNELEPNDDLDAFLQMVNRTQEPDLERAFSRTLEVDRLLRSMTMEALVGNAIQTDSGSYLVHDRITDRWTYVPWDVNNADSTFWPTYPANQQPFPERPVPVYSLLDKWIERLYLKRQHDAPDYLPAFSNLNTRVAFHPVLRERFAATLERALDELYATGEVERRIDAMYALIEPAMRNDPYIDLTRFREGPRYLKAYHARRETFLRDQIRGLRQGLDGLVLETVDPRAGIIELRNRGGSSVQMGGLVVTNNLRRALAPKLPSRLVAPGEVVRLETKALGLDFDAAGGEVGLFDGRSVAGAIDVMFYGPLAAGQRVVRSPKDPARWLVDGP